MYPKKEIAKMFKPKRVEKRSHKASCKLDSELTGIALNSMNIGEYSKKLVHSSRTQNIHNEDRNAPSHPFSIY